ncbi:MAG: hypothetical protein AAGA03_10275 [Planctomycetota bacterium]
MALCPLRGRVTVASIASGQAPLHPAIRYNVGSRFPKFVETTAADRLFMPDRRFILLTFDGLACSSLGCYGSSWSLTPGINHLAANGTTWHRHVATHDQPWTVFQRWLAEPATTQWARRQRELGTVELLTDDGQFANSLSEPSKSVFDALTAVAVSDTDSSDHAADDLDRTRLGQLVAAVSDRMLDPAPWGALWLHSSFLTRCWDAPRSLIPDQFVEEPSLEPIDPADESLEKAQVQVHETAPQWFDQVVVPRVEIDQRFDPDQLTAWMQTYSCQTRLIDVLLSVLQDQAASLDEPIVWVIAGTSGFSFGQNGWIGHACGPLRSEQIRLPLIISDGSQAIHVPQITDSDSMPSLLLRCGRGKALVTPEQLASDARDEYAPAVRTRSDRCRQAITTPQWYAVVDRDDRRGLYSKPDDLYDANDISRLSPQVMERLIELA